MLRVFHSRPVLFSIGAAALAPFALVVAGCGGTSAVDADDWIDDFCEAAEDYEDANDDLSSAFGKIDFEKKGARNDVVDVIEDVQKELATFKKAASKAGTPKLDSGKDVRKAVDDEFEEAEEGYKKLIAAVKKLDEGNDFEDDLIGAFSDMPEPSFRSKLERLAGRRATKDAQDIIDGIDDNAGCATAAF